jgi:hypothetical protein
VWSIGLTKAGTIPERGPYKSKTFAAARVMLINILDEAASCARDAGAKDEAKALRSALSRMTKVKLYERREVNLAIGGYEYWMAQVH